MKFCNFLKFIPITEHCDEKQLLKKNSGEFFIDKYLIDCTLNVRNKYKKLSYKHMNVVVIK